jgi:hypothetical protein
MRRLAHHLFTLCAAVSLLLCVAVCVLWVRSISRADQVWIVPRREGVMLIAGSQAGSVGVGWLQPHAGPGVHLKTRPAEKRMRWFGFSVTDASIWKVIVPHWTLAIGFAAIPAGWLLNARRSPARLGEGHCRRCGYDLRASPERCSECGTPAK